MLIASEPTFMYKKVKVQITHLNDELINATIIPGMVLEAFGEFEDGISTGKFLLNDYLILISTDVCTIIDSE